MVGVPDWVLDELGLGEAEVVAMRVVEDVMSPTISAGDVVLIDPAVREVTDAGVYAVRVNGNLGLRNAVHRPDGVWISAQNEQAAPGFQVSADDIKAAVEDENAKVRIEGRALRVSTWRRV